jgi:ATP-dependent DNA helicase DinG
VWLNRVDNIIKPRLDRKGIIHTVSYARRDMVMRSKYSGVMMTHGRADTEIAVEEFKGASSPAILVSPTMATGWDFPDDECRWQIIVKLPYPDTRGAIMKAMIEGDPSYVSYLVMQQLIQAAGRGVRSETDWCETFIIDNNITWFLRRNRKMALGWFLEAYSVERMLPRPPN